MRSLQPLTDLFDTFFPRLCPGCQKRLFQSENILCILCERTLPLSNNYHLTNSDLLRKLCGKIPVESAASYLVFEHHSIVQNLIHQLKYKGNQEIGIWLGSRLGKLIKQDISKLKDIDIVVPLPLHPIKLRKRGYNQCDSFAKSISEILGVPYSTHALTRIVRNDSQTKMSKHKRFNNVDKIFEVIDESIFVDKHALLVDDVITTGATAESCLATILEVKGAKVSFAAMAEVKSTK